MDATSMIHLDRVTKIYPGSETPAVEELTLDIHKGEILVLVGPSGCGKSTTLRLINRMIEPSGGTILFDGEDVTNVNPDHLRRRIGYVIQQIGLFPHHTIADNIATVPKMLGWDKKRIRVVSTSCSTSWASNRPSTATAIPESFRAARPSGSESHAPSGRTRT